MKKITYLLVIMFLFGSVAQAAFAASSYQVGDIIEGKYIKTFDIKNSQKKNGKGKASIKVERGAGHTMKVFLDCYDYQVAIKKNKKSLKCGEWTELSKKKDTLKFDYTNLTGKEEIMYVALSVQNESGGVEEQLNKAIVIAPAKTESKEISSVYSLSKTDHVKGGDKKSKVVFITYTDLECPFCKQFNKTINQLSAKYGDDVAFVYRHFPLTEIHKSALPAAIASECVASFSGNNAFFNFINQLSESQAYGSYTQGDIEEAAKYAGVTVKKLNSCIDDGTFTHLINAQRMQGEMLGIAGTPTSFAIGKDGTVRTIDGAQPYEDVKRIIDGLLE